MAKRLAFLPEVVEEIEEARDWYVERNPNIANRFLAVLERVLDSIELHPQQASYHDANRVYRVAAA